MKVRAKFECTSIEDHSEYQQKLISFSPVIKDDCEENKSFSKLTPAGQISLNVSYETPACNAFEVYKEYYIDFTPCE